MNKKSLLELTKMLNIPLRNCMKTKEDLEEAIKDTITEYKKITFGSDISVCITCLDETRKQQIIDQHVYNQKLIEDTVRKLACEGLQKDIVIDSDITIDKRTGEALDLEVDSRYWKTNFNPIL